MKKRVFAAIIGILLLGACAAYIAATAFGVTDVTESLMRGWWAIFLIIPGILGLFSKGSRGGSLGLLLLGIGLYCNEQEWFGLLNPTPDLKWWQMALAILLFLCGFGFIRSAFGKKKKYVPGNISINGDTISIEAGHGKKKGASRFATYDKGNEHSAVFSNSNCSYSGKEFTGAELSGVFGTIELDLRGAIIPGDCTIEAAGVFGSVIIYDGGNANFEVQRNSIFGNVSVPNVAHDDSLPTITLIANSVFGDVEVK